MGDIVPINDKIKQIDLIKLQENTRCYNYIGTIKEHEIRERKRLELKYKILNKW